MESTKTLINVCYTPAQLTKKESSYFRLCLNTSVSYDSIMKKLKEELRKLLELKKLPESYSIKLDINPRPVKIDKRTVLWKYCYKNRTTGQRTNPSYIEMHNNRVPIVSELKKYSGLADFSDTWALQTERTDRRKVNNKWVGPEELSEMLREREKLTIIEKVYKSKIERKILKGKHIRKEILSNPDYQEEVRFSWQFLLAS